MRSRSRNRTSRGGDIRKAARKTRSAGANLTLVSAFKNGDLVAQGEDLDVLVPIAHG
jgi:hypothetical protein